MMEPFLPYSAGTNLSLMMQSKPMMRNKPVVLGLGNPLFQDEGLGIHLIQQLMQNDIDDQVELIDGGTDALALLGVVEEAEYLLIIDAIDDDAPAGTIRQLSGDAIPLLATCRMSAHQIGFQEVLALASLRGKLPAHIVLFGVQPQSLDWGTELSPPVANTLPLLTEMVYTQINAWIA